MIGHQYGDSEGDYRSGDCDDGEYFEIQLLLQLIALDDIEGIDKQDETLHPQNFRKQRDVIEPGNGRSTEIENSIKNDGHSEIPEEDGGIIFLRGLLLLYQG